MVGRQITDIADTLQLRDIAMATIFWLYMGAHWCHLASTTEPSVCGSYAALLWPPYVIGQAIIFLPCGFFYLYFFLA